MGVCKTRNFLGFSGIVALGSFGLSDRVSIFGEYISSSIKTCSLVSSVSYTTNKIMFYLMTLTDILALKYDYDCPLGKQCTAGSPLTTSTPI